MDNDLERRREIGQFFTPPLVAGFTWNLLEVIHGGRFFAKTRVIDPACGEGVFLRVAVERHSIAADFLFGTDIDEMLATVWCRDLLPKSVHLFVANGLVDLPDRGVQAGSFDVVVGNPPFAGKGLRDILRLLDEPDTAFAAPETDLFGALVLQERPVPIGPPLKPQERAKLDQLPPLRTWLLTEMDLLAVVSLPQKVFAGVGANARTSVVFARRLLRPRNADEYGDDAPETDIMDESEDSGAGRKVLMAAPNTDSPAFSLEHYFETVLQDARESAKLFQSRET